MKIKLPLALLLLPFASCKVSFGFCSNPSEMEGFDREKFKGKWFEIKRDKDHDFWQWGQKCPVSYY